MNKNVRQLGLMKRVLLIVDPQNDFITGSLPVPRAAEAMECLTKWMQVNRESYDAIVVTMDQHPHNHCSFAERGGQWPVHCVRYSEGAAIYPSLYDEICKQAKGGKELVFIEKATEVGRDAYSAFAEDVPEILRLAEHIYLAGLAGDYCVAETHHDLKRYIVAERIELLREGIAYISPPEE